MRLSRREFLAGGGTILVAFTWPSLAQEKLPGSLEKQPMLDGWIGVGADGRITIFTGKAELGQGILTALQQIAADQLSVDFSRIDMVSADTERTTDEGYTAGSNSMKDSGTAILNAAAQAREILASRQPLNVRAQPRSPLKDPSQHALIGKSVPRVDIPRKVTGGVSYVHDLRLPGMVHARVVRPPAYGLQLRALDEAAVTRMPGVLKVVRLGRFLAVVTEQEFQAVRAMRALAGAAKWDGAAALPGQDIYSQLRRMPSTDIVILGEGATPAAAGRVLEAEYHRPYQIHGAIGPSCAVAMMRGGKLTVWTHSQGVFPLRGALSEMLAMPPERVHCIHMEGSGCYGHNGADDAAADAALIARAFPDRPVRVQWMREDEHAWEPYGSAMISRARASLDGRGRVASWQYDVWSSTHSTRPGKAGQLLPATLLASPFTPPTPQPVRSPDGQGDRNAIPPYTFPNARVTHHFIAGMPLRVSALRALGAYTNVFSIESFMDEMALAARADPVAFRLSYLDDPRAREVVTTAAQRFGWDSYARTRNRGRGFAYARYKNSAAYCAVALDVEVDRESGDVRVGRVVSAIDSGMAVNPDGIRNQTEGGIVQSLSWTLFEAVTWDANRITSRDWGRYPMLRFEHAPKSIDVHVIDRPGQPFLGTGEAAQGPAAAALANAVADALGVRVRDIPLDRAAIRASLARA